MLIQGPRGSVQAADFPGRQGRLVFASLALSGQPLLRETLADRVWPDQLPKAWERDLSTVVSKLRALLVGVGLGGRDVITNVSTAYQLRLPPDAQTDVDRAGELASAAEAALRAGEYARAVKLGDDVAAVAAQPFLPGEDAPWIDEVRAGLRQLHQRALQAAAAGQSGLGHHTEALRLTEQAIALDPFRESAYRLLMQIYLDLGDRAQAVDAYERCRRRLAGELGLDPSPETQALHLTALQAGAQTAVPDIRYARSGRVSIAYQVIGEGPVDLVLVPGWISNLELAWEEPRMAGFLRRLASMARLIMFDKRGTGLSDPIPIDTPPDLDVRMDDVRAVMDAATSRRAVLLGFSEGGAMSLLFAASHPDRTLGLVLWGSWVRQRPGPDFPLGWSREEGLRRFVRPIQETGIVDSRWFAPSVAGEPEFERWFRRYARHSASPGMAIALLRANAAMDVRPVLPAVRVPALVLQRTDDVLVEVGHGRYLARHLPGARYTELAGRDHWPWFGDSEAVLAQIGQFLDGLAPGPVPDEVLATVVCVRGAAPTDRLHAYRGVLVSSFSSVSSVSSVFADGVSLVARFDGPVRAVRFAADAARDGAQVGVHTGLLTLHGSQTSGPALEGARELASMASPGEVLLTGAVADLTAGSELRPTERAGRPGVWSLAGGAT